MGWMRTDYSFNQRAAILTLPREHARKSATMTALVELLKMHSVSERPEELETVGLRVVHTYRPELIGCVLWFIDYDPATLCWEFAVSHGSLPAVAMGDCLPKWPIDSGRQFQHPMLPSSVQERLAAEIIPEAGPELDALPSKEWFDKIMSQPAE